MNEKVIVKGEFAKNKIATLLLVAAGITFIGSVLVGVMAYNEDTYSTLLRQTAKSERKRKNAAAAQRIALTGFCDF